jgi:hypothetical protein
MSRPKRYVGLRETISPLIDCQLKADFDEFCKNSGSTRNEEINKAMENHIQKSGELELFKVDLADNYCDAHKIAVVGGKLIGLRGDLSEEIVSVHKISLRLINQNITLT